MGNRALVKDQVHTISRKNPRTGFTERISFVGDLRTKPSGWRVEKYLGPAMRAESGTV